MTITDRLRNDESVERIKGDVAVMLNIYLDPTDRLAEFQFLVGLKVDKYPRLNAQFLTFQYLA